MASILFKTLFRAAALRRRSLKRQQGNISRSESRSRFASLAPVGIAMGPHRHASLFQLCPFSSACFWGGVAQLPAIKRQRVHGSVRVPSTSQGVQKRLQAFQSVQRPETTASVPERLQREASGDKSASVRERPHDKCGSVRGQVRESVRKRPEASGDKCAKASASVRKRPGTSARKRPQASGSVRKRPGQARKSVRAASESVRKRPEASARDLFLLFPVSCSFFCRPKGGNLRPKGGNLRPPRTRPEP